MMPLVHAKTRSAGNAMKGGLTFEAVHILNMNHVASVYDFKVTGTPRALTSVEFPRTAHQTA